MNTSCRVSTVIMVLGCIIVFSASWPAAAEDPQWFLEGTAEQFILASFEDNSFESGTLIAIEAELGGRMEFAGEYAIENQGSEEVLNEAEFDFEILPAFELGELALYVETDFELTEKAEAEFGVEGEISDFDFDLGMSLGDTENVAYFDYYRRFQNGVTLRGEIEVEDGYKFRTNRVQLRGIPLQLGDDVWELSCELDVDTDGGLTNYEDLLESEFELENDRLTRIPLTKQRKGINFYSVELLPVSDKEAELAEVVLHSSISSKRDLKGWIIRSEDESHEIKKETVIGPGEKISIRVTGEFLQRGDSIYLVNSDGDTVDAWSFPYTAEFDSTNFARNAVIERNIEISFSGAEFEEMSLTWDGEIPVGEDELIFGGLEIDHTGELAEVLLGYEFVDSEVEVSLLDREIALTFDPELVRPNLDAELALELNADLEFELEFETDHEFDNFDLENGIVFYSEPGEQEIELYHAISWENLEVEGEYLFINNTLAEAGVEAEVEF